MNKQLIARWESKSGKYWAELYMDSIGPSYKGVDCGGSMGNLTADAAVAAMQQKVDMGYFQPDANKTPMKRVQ